MKKLEDNSYWVMGDVGILRIESIKYGLKKFLFDAEDLNRILALKWSYKPNKDGNDYAHSNIGCRRTGYSSTISLHRLVTSFEWDFVDHINRNTFDNRKKNLREISSSNNLANSHTHDMKGVRIVRGMYEPTVIINGKDTKLARTSNLDEAKIIFRKAHNKHYGEFSPYTLTGELK